MSEAETLAMSMKNLQIDQKGEVTLQLADKSELQVSSKVLSLASRVFKAIFSSKFAEGSALVEGRNCHVPLPEDNLAAIVLLCMILYPRSDILKVEVGAELMEHMAILSDKYDCTRFMGLWSALSLKKRVDEVPETALVDRQLFLAIVFDEPEYFQLVTKCMVYTVTDIGFDATDRVPVHSREMLPDGLICMSMLILRLESVTHVLTSVVILMTKYRKIKKEILSDLDGVVTDLLVKPWPDKPGLTGIKSFHRMPRATSSNYRITISASFRYATATISVPL